MNILSLCVDKQNETCFVMCNIKKVIMETKYICPDCGHEFEQGEYGYNYDYNVLEFDCPFCGWSGNDNTVEIDDECNDD